MYQGPQDTRILSGVMDQDSAAWAVDKDNYRYAENLVNTYNKNTGSHTNLLGTQEVVNPFLKGGENICIGAFENIQGGSVVYMVYNSFGYHSIFEWKESAPGFTNGVINLIHQVADPNAYTIYNPNPLDFHPDSLITGMNMVDGMLFWTDYKTGPHFIDTRKFRADKPRVWRLYFNDLIFGQAATHTINVYQQGIAAPVATLSFNIASGVNTYQDAVNALFLQYSASGITLFSIADIGNYAELTMSVPGIYDVQWLVSLPAPNYGGVAVPHNFYPDSSGTPASPPALSDDLVDAMKYPPFCSPTARFLDGENLGRFFLQLTPFSGSLSFSTQNYQYGINPLNPPYFSDNGYVVSGAGQSFSGPFSPTAYLINVIQPSPAITDPVTMLLTWNLSINLTDVNTSLVFPSQLTLAIAEVGGPSPRITLFQVNNQISNAGGPGWYPNPVNFNLQGSGEFTMQPGVQYIVFATWDQTGFTISGTISGAAKRAGQSVNFSRLYPQFRAKYVYAQNQNSVYGAISTAAVAKNDFQDEVEVDFSDIRLQVPQLVCDIKTVVLATSLDGGVTWSEFARLDPYEFVGPGRQKRLFTSTEVLVGVPEAEAILPYHNIPRLAKSQEYIDDRIWYGGMLTGYNKTQAQYRIETIYETPDQGEVGGAFFASPPYSISRWRRGWKGYVGIVYYDDGDRRSPVCLDPENARIEIAPYGDDIIDSTTGQTVRGLHPAYLRVVIRHAPPDWATKYQLVRTKDLSQDDYLLWSANEIKYANEDDSVLTNTPTGSTRYVRIDISSIAYYINEAFKGSKISFSFVEGDRVRFVMDIDGNILPSNDYVIQQVTNDFVYITYDGNINVRNGVVMEFYSPAQESESLLFYEFGQCYPVAVRDNSGRLEKYHVGNEQSQVFPDLPFLTAVDTVVACKEGDVWYRNRNMYYFQLSTTIRDFRTRFISALTPSDFTEVEVDNNGRPNSPDLPEEVYQDTGFVFSDRYITGTQTNGLNAVQPANIRVLNTVYGLLNKMQVVNNDVLRLIFGNGYQMSIYVNQSVIRQGQGAGNIISTIDDVANNSHIIQRTLGTINPESVAVNDSADVFGYDGTEGVVWLSGSNGVVDVSNTGMSMTWRDYGLQRLPFGKLAKSPAVFDLGRDLYFITLNALTPQQKLPRFSIKPLPITGDGLGLGGVNVTVVQTPTSAVLYNQNTPAPTWLQVLRAALPTWTINQDQSGVITGTGPDLLPYNVNGLVVTITYNAVSYAVAIPITQSLPESATGFTAITLTFRQSGPQNRKPGWVSFMSFTPEYYGRLRNNTLLFRSGRLYLLGKSPTYNEFFGVGYPSRIRYLLNNDYPKVKVPLALWYRGRGRWGAMLRNPATASHPWGQETEMTPNHFLLEEDGYYSEVLKNRLDPRYPTTDQAWVNGEDIRGDAVEIEFYAEGNQQLRLDSTKTIYLYSENS